MHEWHRLYAKRMDLELRQLRCLVAIADTGTFTDAGIELGISQAAVSRNLLALERALGVRLLHRTSRSVTPTTAGVHALAQARQILAAVANLVSEATTGHTALRVGHAWSAMGRHTREFQRRWAVSQPEIELHLVRVNSPTGGLAEGLCDVAVLRVPSSGSQFAGDRFASAQFDSAVVGWERRYLAVAADDPWARRRSVTLAEAAGRTVVIDRRTGTTTPDLWPPARGPCSRHPGHRRLARDHRGRRRGGHHPRGHHRPVPARRRGVPAAARRAADRGPPLLAAA